MGICLIIKSGGGIDTSAATATADTILSGYTIYKSDNKVTGTMTSIGAQTASGLNAGGSTTIKAGFHNGTGIVTTNTLASQTSGDIPDAGWCLSGYTYWKNGAKATGTMSNRGKKEWKLGANGSQTIEGGWHDGNGTISQSLSVDNNECWRTPSTAQQQVCWSGVYYSKNRGCYGSSSLTAANIKKDITIFGVTGNYYDPVRWIVQNGALCNGVSLEWTYQYIPNDSGTSRWDYNANASPSTKNVSGNAYIMTMYYPQGNDSSLALYHFSGVGAGNFFKCTGSSASDWKIASLHIGWAANGNDRRNLRIHYAFGDGGTGFTKTVDGAIWTWYSKTYTGSLNVTSVSSTTAGLPYYMGWPGSSLKNGTLYIGISGGSSSYSTAFYIRNLWVDNSIYI